MIAVFAPAKINLALHVTGRRSDSYHLLDTLVAFASVGDWISVVQADGLTLSADGPFANQLPPSQDNLVMKAATALQSRMAQAGMTAEGARLHLIKNLPPASGMGGGSADAAAALIALGELWGAPRSMLEEVSASIGADGPMCLASRTLRAGGIGEKIDFATEGQYHAVLVHPSIAVPTPAVFAGLQNRENPAMPAELPMDVNGLAQLRNDLEAPALALFPVIGDVLAAIRSTPGCRLARMSGSGASCFGLYDDPAGASVAAASLANAQPAWWVRQAELGGDREALASKSNEA